MRVNPRGRCEMSERRSIAIPSSSSPSYLGNAGMSAKRIRRRRSSTGGTAFGVGDIFANVFHSETLMRERDHLRANLLESRTLGARGAEEESGN